MHALLYLFMMPFYIINNKNQLYFLDGISFHSINCNQYMFNALNAHVVPIKCMNANPVWKCFREYVFSWKMIFVEKS